MNENSLLSMAQTDLMTGIYNRGNANEIFERIFKQTEKLNIKALGNRRITLSLGACFYDGIADISYDSLYCNADEAMYKSKKNKGFCATIYEP